ncbi:MAG TPA: hypothetical protein ENO14_01850 [Chromatiales bacterium]|nr:hypothetical protein [Chromatiales bacterium]
MILPLALSGITGVLATYNEAIEKFSDTYRMQFLGMGFTLYRSFALVIIVWAGAQMALSGRGPDMGKVIKLVFVLAFGYALINDFGNTGSPWSLTSLVEHQVRLMANQFNQRALGHIATAALEHQDAAAARLGVFGGLTNLSGALEYVIITGVWMLLQAVAWFVVCFGDIAVAVCVVLGPIFIPFFIVPKLDWLFWGWLRAYMQFAFYKLVATIVVHIIADGISRACGAPAGGTFFHFLPYLMVAVASTGVLLKVPALTSHIFSGSAGSDGSLLSIAQNSVSSAVRAGVGVA